VNITFAQPYIRVIDDLLCQPEWESVVIAAESVVLRDTIPGTAIWKGTISENPKESYEAIVWPPEGSEALVAECAKAAGERSLPMRFYPTRVALDLGLEAIVNVAKTPEGELVIGRELTDWVAITTSIYAYSAGTRAMWHDDGRFYSGAFIY
jgi:hypothetical protein